MNSTFRSTLLALAVAALAGCNAPGERSKDVRQLSWPVARAYDFMDVFELNVAAGTGLHAAAAIEPVRVGLGWYDTAKMGMMGRGVGIWDEDRREFFLGHELMFWKKNPCYGNAYLFDVEETKRMNHVREPTDHSRLAFWEPWCWTTRYQDYEKPWLDVDAEVHVCFLGLRAGVSPQELADFFLGLFLVDTISHDDYAAVPRDIDLPVAAPPVETELQANPEGKPGP